MLFFVPPARLYVMTLNSFLRAGLLALAASALASCDMSDPQSPVVDCTTWDNCEAGLVLHLDVVEGAFRRQNQTRYFPGDSILVRGRLENRTRLLADSILLTIQSAGIVGPQQYQLDLQPRGSFAFVDTLVVGGFTFDQNTDLKAEVWQEIPPYGFIDLRVTGDAEVDIAKSGYKFEVFPVPGARSTFQYGGWTMTGLRMPHQTTIGIRALVTNTYETDLPPIGMGICFFDFDHCYLQVESPNKTPVLKPGSTAYIEMELPLDTRGNYFDWWGQRPVALSICARQSYSGDQCASELILLTANYEKDCSVRDATIGAPMTTGAPDCGYLDDGSAYRFVARAGERYRVSLVSGSGNVFITAADGSPDDRMGPAELTIPRDGTYYVAALHRSGMTFLLEKLP
jgi:hypothetical protein